MTTLLLALLAGQSAWEAQLTAEINAYRVANGEAVVIHDQRLADACYAWSREQNWQKDNSLDHCNPLAALRLPWLKVAGTQGWICGPDKAFTYGWPSHVHNNLDSPVKEVGLNVRQRRLSAARAVRLWAGSPPHRAAMLWPEATHAGGSRAGKTSFLLLGQLREAQP